jgi:hypothetical protein
MQAIVLKSTEEKRERLTQSRPSPFGLSRNVGVLRRRCGGWSNPPKGFGGEGGLFALRAHPGRPFGRFPRFVAVPATDPSPLEFMSRLAEREGLLAATPLIPR